MSGCSESRILPWARRSIRLHTHELPRCVCARRNQLYQLVQFVFLRRALCRPAEKPQAGRLWPDQPAARSGCARGGQADHGCVGDRFALIAWHPALLCRGNRQDFGSVVPADATGERLWQYATQIGVIAPPISYQVAGSNLWRCWRGGVVATPSSPRSSSRRAAIGIRPAGCWCSNWTALRGKLSSSREDGGHLPELRDQRWSAEVVARGKALYYHNCAVCHGDAAVSGYVLPDLRYSPVLANDTAWRQIVIGGALTANGMVSFKRWLTDADASSIRAYVAGESLRLQDDLHSQ